MISANASTPMEGVVTYNFIEDNKDKEKKLSLIDALKRFLPSHDLDAYGSFIYGKAARENALEILYPPFSIETWEGLSKALQALNCPLNTFFILNSPAELTDVFQRAIANSRVVDLNGDHFKEDFIALLCSKIIQSKKTDLFFIWGKISELSMIALAQLVHIVSLKIIRANCGFLGANVFGHSLSSRQATLASLSLINCNIDPLMAERIVDGLLNNHSVRFLDLSENPLGNEGVRHIAHLFKVNTLIEKLILNRVRRAQNESLDKGVVELSAALVENPNNNVNSLSLVYNGLTDVGITSIAQYIKITKKLTKLDIGKNYDTKEEGVIAVSQALTHNRSLRILSFFINDGVPRKPLLDAIDPNNKNSNKTLMRLDLDFPDDLFELDRFSCDWNQFEGWFLLPRYEDIQKERWKIIANLAVLSFLKNNRNIPIHLIKKLSKRLMATFLPFFIQEFDQYVFIDDPKNLLEKDKRALTVLLVMKSWEKLFDTKFFKNWSSEPGVAINTLNNANFPKRKTASDS